MKRLFFVLVAFVASVATLHAQYYEDEMGYYQSGYTTRTVSRSFARHTLALNFNPGFITSKVYVGSNTETWKFGLGYGADYRCIFDQGFGFGLSFMNSMTDYTPKHSRDEGRYGGSSYYSYFDEDDFKLKLTYAGASFVYGGDMDNGLSLWCSAGVGWAHYSWGDKGDGVGFQGMAGIEYSFTDIIAIGADLTELYTVFGKNDNLRDDEINGFSRLGVNVGLRFKF